MHWDFPPPSVGAFKNFPWESLPIYHIWDLEGIFPFATLTSDPGLGESS